MAAEHLRRIDAAHHAAQPQAGVDAIENVGPFFDKRTGPILAIAAGPISQSDAQTLLGAVNWSPSVTWNENTYFDKKNNIANLLVNIILLCIIVGAISLAAGSRSAARVCFCLFFFTSVPDSVSGPAGHDEFISLDLRGPATQASTVRPSSTPDASNRS